MEKRKLITKQGTDPEIFRMVELVSQLESLGTPVPTKKELKDRLALLMSNSIDFPRTSTGAEFLIELLNEPSIDVEEVLEKARELIDKLKEDLGVP